MAFLDFPQFPSERKLKWQLLITAYIRVKCNISDEEMELAFKLLTKMKAHMHTQTHIQVYRGPVQPVRPFSHHH